MSTPSPSRKAMRPKNLNPLELGLKLPVAGIVSLLHRASGILLFMAIPLVIFVLDISLRNELAFADIYRFLNSQPMKIAGLVLLWAFFHHLIAGIRFLLLDMHIGVSKPFPKITALVTLALSLALTAILGAKLW